MAEYKKVEKRLRKEANIATECTGDDGLLSEEFWERTAEADQDGERTGSSSSKDKEKDWNKPSKGGNDES
jgi:hypothetical protein